MTDPPPTPRDARTIQSILSHMGITSYDPRVVNQLLELLYRYVSSVLLDARHLSDHADRLTVEPEDIRLAIRTRTRFLFTQPPPRDVTMRMAQERNTIPLPPLGIKAGVAMPAPDLMLTAQNFDVLIENRKRQRLDSQTPERSPKRMTTSIPTPPSNLLRPAKSPKRPTSATASPVRAARPQVDSDVMIIDPPATARPTAQLQPKHLITLPNSRPNSSLLPSASVTSLPNASVPHPFDLDPPLPPQ